MDFTANKPPLPPDSNSRNSKKSTKISVNGSVIEKTHVSRKRKASDPLESTQSTKRFLLIRALMIYV